MVRVCIVVVTNFKRFRWNVGDTKLYLDVLCPLVHNAADPG